MDDEDVRRKATEEAGRALGEEMAKFPLLFAKAVFYGQRPTRHRPTQINNGTICLVDFGRGPCGITCWHVLDGYRKAREGIDDVLFQVGSTDLDPIAQLIDEDERLDIAVIEFTAKQAGEITAGGKIGSEFFRPVTWPAPAVHQGEYVVFGGFPGSMRTLMSFNEIDFPSWSSGGSQVSSASDYQFVSAFERLFWVKSFGEAHNMDLTALGGVSGGPAFVKRRLHWDIVGIVKEYSENYDAMFFASLSSFHSDGTLEQPIVEQRRERGRW
ncbi:MAG: trypsin-like peptidase domain-containing protein [Deltaproteobacteria bacterium]|nr:trypsin-like peptidase domain-containing protein [Deltaproteobacteria bacterium]